MTRLRLAQAAIDDIRDIRRYSKATFGAAVARTYVDGLRGIFAVLCRQPAMGAVEPRLEPAIRGFAYRSHRLYYRLEGGEIVVVRILHHARDARRALRDDA